MSWQTRVAKRGFAAMKPEAQRALASQDEHNIMRVDWTNIVKTTRDVG